MVNFSFKRLGIKYEQVWFNSHTDISAFQLSKNDILEFKESYVALPSLGPFTNGVIDLSEGLDAIHDKFDKGFKYEIRRAEKEGCVCEALTPTDEGSLQRVFHRYKAFCDEKSIPFIPFEFIRLYHQSGNLHISLVKAQDVVVQFHMYFKSPDELILLASFPSDQAESMKRAIVGFANRYLHWYDIQYTSREKIKLYNLGGIGNSNDPHTVGIVKFKMEMEPQSRKYYQGLIGVSLKGKCFLKLKRILKKV